jgi:hypothetical protein|tara:strand:+ start:1463 stop:1918 length:456 start_codon:yes stop_codon:yes gene_type:complete
MKKDIKNIIIEVLEKLEKLTKIPVTEEAVNLIYETGMAESGYRALVQKGGGPALSFFQIEPDTARDIFNNYVEYRPSLVEALIYFGVDPLDLEFSLKTNIAVAVCLCRLHYRRVPEPIPRSKKFRAEYWKQYYNTEKGKGTTEHFLKANKD